MSGHRNYVDRFGFELDLRFAPHVSHFVIGGVPRFSLVTGRKDGEWFSALLPIVGEGDYGFEYGEAVQTFGALPDTADFYETHRAHVLAADRSDRLEQVRREVE